MTHDGKVVGDEQITDPGVAPDLREQIEHLGLDRDVEGRDGFVQDQYLRLGCKRASDRGTLALAADRPLRVGVPLSLVESHLVEQLIDPLLA